MLKLSRKQAFGGFCRAQKGLAAVEFALILPVLMAMLFGMGELSLAVFARADITQVTSTVADLVAQESTPSATDLSNVYNAGYMIMYPYTGRPSIRITSVIYDTGTGSKSVGKVGWTCTNSGGNATLPGTLPVKGNPYTVTDTQNVAQNMLDTGGSVLMVEVAYTYTSPTAHEIFKSKVYSDKFYTKPRRVGQIPAPASCPTT